MNPMLLAAISSIIRWGLTFLSGYLVKKGIWDNADAIVYVGAATTATLTLGWSLWEKYHSRLVLLTALTMPSGITEKDVLTHLSTGAQVPSVSTPVNQVPLVEKKS